MNASALVLATVLPESILGARWFAVLSTFVAINTILYVSMSIFKILPKPYLSDVVRRYGRRAETRSINPDEPSVPDEGPTARDDRRSRTDAQTTIDRDLTGSQVRRSCVRCATSRYRRNACQVFVTCSTSGERVDGHS